MPKAARLFVYLLTISLFSVTVVAQDESDSESSKEVDSVEDWDRLIYVPFKELQKVFDNQKASAVVPYAEYMTLLKAYMNRDAAVATSPDAVITESHFVGRVEKDVVRLTAELSITVLKEKGWARLPVSFGNSAIGKVTADDEKNTILQGLSAGKYELLLNGAGKHSVSVELMTTVNTSPEHRSFAMQCPTVGISDLTLTIPEANQAVEVSPLQVLLPMEGSSEEQTVVKASLGSTDRFEVRWNPEAGSKPVMDLLASASNETRVRVEPGLLQSTATIRYEVLRGELSEVSVQVPEGARIIDVVPSSGRIRNWNSESVEGSHQHLRIELLNPVTDQFQVDIQTELVLEGDAFQLVGKLEDGSLQGVHADGVVRESGKLTLITDSALTTIVKSQTGVQRIEAVGSGKGNARSGSQAWEFSGTTGSLVLQTRPVEPRLLVDQAARVVFSDDQLKLFSRLDYTVERAGVFQLELTYPESLTIDSVRADGMSEFNVDKNSGRLTLSLTQKRQGKITVDITAHQAFNAAAEAVETQIPSIVPLNVERENGSLGVFAPQFLDVATIDETLEGLFPAESSQARGFSGAVEVSSWKYTQRPFQLLVRTTPRPAQLAASVATTASIEPDVVKVTSNVAYMIQNAGIDTFRIAVPEALVDDIRFRSLNPRHTIQQRDKASSAEDGWVTWTLVLQDEITGNVSLEAEWEVPLESVEDASVSRSLLIQPIRILPPFTDEQADKRKVTLTQPKGELKLLRHESLSITANGAGDTIEKIDVRELELLPRDGYLAFQYFSQPASVAVDIRKHEIHEVVATVVSKAAIEVVTDKQPLASYRCRLRITSSERQRLLIQLPAGADLQAPLLNGQRTTFEAAADAKAVTGWDAYYVNTSRAGDSDEEFLLSFQFRAPITAPDEFPYEGQGSKQFLRLPLIGDDSGSTVIQETRAAIWSPDDISFVGEPRNWKLSGKQKWSFWNPMVSLSSPSEAQSIHRWVGDSNGTSDFAQQGNVTVYRSIGRQATVNIVWWNRPFLVAVICGALVFVGFILRRTSWENRLTLVILSCLAVAVWSLKDSSETLQFLSAGSLGIVAVAAIWLLGLFLGQRSRPASNAGTPPTTSPPHPASSMPIPGPEENISAPPAAPSPPTPPAAISPSPEVADWMNKLMGGK